MPTEKKPEYSPGLAGVIAGETAICWVDPAAGLMYRGYDIHDMAQKASFEEVAYLLLNGELPNGKQLVEFTQQIAAERALPGAVIEMLRLLPSKTHPMDMLRTGVSMLSAFDKDLSDNSHDANIRKSIRLIACVSTLITDGWRISHDEQPLPERPDLTQAGNFFYKLQGRVPQDWQIRMLDTIFNLYADHEFNASTFAARVTASTLAGIYAAVSSAVATLKGPLHGCANVDHYATPVLWMLGCPPEVNTPLFAASRVADWCAHVTEQHDNNRLIRPRSLYVGPALRPYPGSSK